jgi:hypothetical protein
MNTTAIKKVTIIQELSRLPETSLDTVKDYLDSLLMDIQVQPLKNQSLKGIWKDAGFENISDLNGELHTIRQELHDAIVKRKV